MPTLQDAFIEFHDKIKLSDENDTLREKREILINKLDKNISDDAASYTKFNQGSYAMNTGIKPEDGDYDIDVGLKFNLNKDDYPDPVVVKKWVKDALYGHTKSVNIRRSCVTVQYQQADDPLYHVDFAIYAANNDDGKLYIAKGEEFSATDKKYWEVSDPQGLISLIAEKHSDTDAQQFRRVIRYMKKWKDYMFTSSGNSAPTGISLTILAYDLFAPNSAYDPFKDKTTYNDFEALRNLANNIKSQFTLAYDVDSNKFCHSISKKLPLEPYNDLFEKMTIKQQEAFYSQLSTMIQKLDEADEKETLSEKCTVLTKLFGDDFPIKTERSLVNSNESA